MSGVAFTVAKDSPHRTHERRELYFCCEACAGHFEKNRAQIAALRGFAAASPTRPMDPSAANR